MNDVLILTILLIGNVALIFLRGFSQWLLHLVTGISLHNNFMSWLDKDLFFIFMLFDLTNSPVPWTFRHVLYEKEIADSNC